MVLLALDFYYHHLIFFATDTVLNRNQSIYIQLDFFLPIVRGLVSGRMIN